jgi:hypothetical protein
MEKIERLFGDYSIVLVSDFIPSDYSLEKISEIIDGALKKIQKYDYDRNNDIVKFEIGDIITYIGKERIIFQHTKENESELLNYVNSFCRVLGEKIIKSYGYNYKNRRNASINSYNRLKDEEDRNRDRVRVGGFPEFTNNNNHNHNFHISNEEYEDNRNRSMDNINYREHFGNKKRRNFGNHGLTSYMPFHKEKIKNFKEDEEEFS